MNAPTFKGINVTTNELADNKDIRDLLEKLVPEATKQMRNYAKQFKGATEQQTAKKIFDFLKNDLNYVADGEQQVIKLPSALMRKKVGDCKSYSLLTASILENLKIPYTFVYASYNSNPIPAHVYVVTESGIIIDAVYGIFNKEKKANYKYKSNMKVGYMAGIGCSCDNKMGNIFTDAKASVQAKLNQAQNSVKAKASQAQATIKAQTANVVQGAKTVSLAPARGLFMLLISKNIDGLASKLSKINTTAFLNKWYSLGGNRTDLANAIKNGASKPERKMGFLPKLKSIVANKTINGIGAIDATTSGAIITLFTSVGTAISGPQGGAVGATLGGVVVQVLPTIIDAVKQAPSVDASGNNLLPATDLNSDLNNSINDESTASSGILQTLKDNALYIVLGLGLGYGVYKYAKK